MYTLVDLAGGAGGSGEIIINMELQDASVDSSTAQQVVKPTDGYIGLKEVTVEPYILDEVTADSSTNPQVITGEHDGLSKVIINPYSLGSLEVDSSTAIQEISGAYSSVTVNPYTLDSKTVDSSTVSQTITSDEDGLSSVTVNPYTLDTSTLVTTENGEFIITSAADGLSRVDVSVNIDTSSYYNTGYGDGYYDGEADGILEGIAEQKAKLDSSIFTINGIYTREDGWNSVEVDVPIPTFNTQSKTVDSSTVSQTVTPDASYDGLSEVIVNSYSIDYLYQLASAI